MRRQRAVLLLRPGPLPGVAGQVLGGAVTAGEEEAQLPGRRHQPAGRPADARYVMSGNDLTSGELGPISEERLTVTSEERNGLTSGKRSSIKENGRTSWERPPPGIQSHFRGIRGLTEESERVTQLFRHSQSTDRFK